MLHIPSTNASVFANPDKNELISLWAISDFFEKASGLITNLAKTEVFSIGSPTSTFQICYLAFPTKWDASSKTNLGLPLHYKRLRKVHLQPLVEQIGKKLPIWMGEKYRVTRKGDFG
jgi:hypothetical protein